MAVLGIQIVVTMIFASVLSRISPFASLGRFLLTKTGLVRYMHPTDEELKELAAIPREKNRKGHGKKSSTNGSSRNDGQQEVFNVPKNLDLTLDKTKVTVSDVVQLRFYSEYQWLIDFTVCAILVYIVTELYLSFFPHRAANEVNLSMVWCLLVAGFAYKLLISLNSLYFQGDETGERSLVIISAFAYLFMAMLVLIVSEDTLETNLDAAYASFNHSAATFLSYNDRLDSSGPASKLVLKFFLALWCGSIGALFTFPGLRLARMQWDVLQHAEGNGFVNVCLHISFVAPLLLTTMWIKPISRDYLTEQVFKGMEKPFMTSSQFETLRLYLILGVILLRLSVMPRYLQSYLNTAYYKIEELKKEAGKISNIELQRIVVRVFYYLCVVSLQYVSPMILILAFTLMYKTMGGGEWTGLWNDVLENVTPSEEVLPLSPGSETTDGHFHLAWNSLKQVFTTSVFHGLLGFSLWWCTLTWFTSAGFGVIYLSHFAKK